MKLWSSFLKVFLCSIGFIPWQMALKTGRFLGRTGYYLDERHRRIALRNLRDSFGDKSYKELKGLTKKVFENLGMNLMEFAHLPRFTVENIGRYVEYRNLEYLDEISREGKGVIFLTGHFGNWELLGHAMAIKGYSMYVIARDADNPIFNELLREWRELSGNRVIDKRRSMRRLLRILKDGGMVGILLDQNVTWREGVFVDFFGRSACTNKGLALLAMASKSPVIPIFIRRKDDNRHEIRIMEKIDIVITGDKDRDILINTQRYTKVIEDCIRKYPDQWFWMHQRWKTRPENDPALKRRERQGMKLEKVFFE